MNFARLFLDHSIQDVPDCLFQIVVVVFGQKHAKYVESGLKALKARNEYVLCLEAANAAVQKYFSDDIHDLINVCMIHLLTVFSGI